MSSSLVCESRASRSHPSSGMPAGASIKSRISPTARPVVTLRSRMVARRSAIRSIRSCPAERTRSGDMSIGASRSLFEVWPFMRCLMPSKISCFLATITLHGNMLIARGLGGQESGRGADQKRISLTEAQRHRENSFGASISPCLCASARDHSTRDPPLKDAHTGLCYAGCIWKPGVEFDNSISSSVMSSSMSANRGEDR